jgi:hypothetical protein
MAERERKTVWILGAGFSRSLGAPLLETLFRQQHGRDFTGVVPQGSLVQDVIRTQMVFNSGRKVGLWEDAEVFLAFTDDAWGRQPTDDYKQREFAQLVENLDFSLCGLRPDQTDPPYKKAPSTVRRALAFETSRFLRFSNPEKDEAWQPYLRWAKLLRTQPEVNSIVTFNYDRVPEMLGLFVPLPHQIGTGSAVPVYKVHGSTNWRVNRNNPSRPHVELNEVTIENDLELALAAPGASKASLSQTLFEPLWGEAVKAISEADEIVIIGYSFPKTDALARHMLLDALHRDTTQVGDDGHHLTRQAHLVLGPDVDVPKNRRVLELIRHRMGSRRGVVIDERPMQPYGAVLYRHRLWAEDFIDDYLLRTREHLL